MSKTLTFFENTLVKSTCREQQSVLCLTLSLATATSALDASLQHFLTDAYILLRIFINLRVKWSKSAILRPVSRSGSRTAQFRFTGNIRIYIVYINNLSGLLNKAMF